MHQSVNIPIKLDQPKQQQSKQNDPPKTSSPQQTKRPSIMERLRALEAEMSVEAAGLQLPEDPELTEKLSTFLAAQHPDADLQITVSSVRKTTTTKQQYETETPGMVGLEVDKLMDLQRKLMAKISANKLAEEAEKQQEEQHPPEEEEEWARRGPPDVQRSEMVEESFPLDEGTKMISKKRTHVVTMSQSRAQGLDDLPMAGVPAPGTKSSHEIKLKSTGSTPQKEDASLSLSLSTSTSSAGSVKEKVARFESMKSKEEAEEAAKKRFGWKGPSMISPPGKKHEEEQQREEEEARKSPSRIPTRSPLPSPTREKDEITKSDVNVATTIMLEKQPEMREEDVNVEEKSPIMEETDFNIFEKEEGGEKQLERNEEIVDIPPGEVVMMAETEERQPQQPTTTMEHMEIIEVGPEVVISHQESHPEIEPASFGHIEKLDAAPIMGIAQIENQQKQQKYLSEPIIISIEPPSAVHEPSPPESPMKEDEAKIIEIEEKSNESDRKYDEEEMEIEENLRKIEDVERREKSGQYMPFGAEIIATSEQQERKEYLGDAEMEPKIVEQQIEETEELEPKIVEQQIEESEMEPKIVEQQIEESEMEPKIVEQQIEESEMEPKIVEQQIEESEELEPKQQIQPEIIEIVKEEPMKLRRISMDTDRPEIGEEIGEKVAKIHKEPEAIEEQLEREGRPELFVTTGLNIQTVEPNQNIEIKVVEPDDDDEEEKGGEEEEFKKEEEKKFEEIPQEKQFEGIPQEKQFEGIPQEKQFEEIPQEKQFEGIPQEKQFEEIPQERQFEGIPQEKQFEEIPQEKQFEEIPQEKQFEGIPQEKQFEEIPQERQFEEIPQEKQFEGIPQEKQFEEIPQEKQFEEIPQEKQFEGIPQEKQFEEIPQEKQFEEIPQEKQFEEIPQEKQFEEIPQEKQFEEIPQEKQFEGIPQEKQFEEIPQEKQFEEIPQEKQFEEITQERQFEEIPQEKQFEEIPQEKQFEEIPQEKQFEEIPQERQFEEIPQERQFEEIPQEKQFEEIPQEKQFEEIPQEKQFEEIPQEKQFEEIPQERQFEEIPQEQIEMVHEMQPEKKEIRSTIWLDNVPIERCAYEEEELAEKKALFWPEEEIGQEKLENISAIWPIMGGIPWFIGRENEENEIVESKEEEMEKLNEMRIEDAQREEMYPNTSELKSQNELESMEEPKEELTFDIGNDQKSAEEEKEMVSQGIQLEQIEPEKPQKFPPPLSPLQSEESIGGLETEDDERSSTHTVIHRPEMLLEEGRTRSLYGGGASSSADFPEETFAVAEQSAMDEQTPTSPVMNAERWKSLDEKSSTIGSPAAMSPSPINIEITRESLEREEDTDKNIEEKEETEFIEEVKPTDELTEQKGMEDFENEEKIQPEIVDNVEIEPQRIEERILIVENVEPIHKSESTSIVQREEEYPGEPIYESEFTSIVEKEGKSPGEVQTQMDVRIDTEIEEDGKEEDLLVESEPVEIDVKETMDMHFDEEGHSPKKHQEMEEEMGNKNEEFELVESQEFVPIEGKPQMESFEYGMGEFESEEQIGNKEEELVEKKDNKIEGEIFSESGEENPQFSAQIVDLPTQEEQKKVEEMEEKSEDQKGDEPEYQNKTEEIDEKKLKNLDEIRNKEETTALGMVTARQAELLVEDVINRVLEEGVPTPDDEEEENSGEEVIMDEEGGISQAEASPEPVSDDWEMVEGEQGKEKQQHSMEELPPEMAQEEPSQSEMIKTQIGIEKEESYEEKDEMKDEEEEEEDEELVKLQLGGNDDEEEDDEKFEEEEDDDIVPDEPESPQPALSTSSEPITAGGSKSFLALSTPVHRPKSPIPPPAAPTPPQKEEKVGESSTLTDTKKDEMEESLILMDEGFTKMPEDVLDLGEESEELPHPIVQQRIQSPPDELEKIHEQMLASGNLVPEEDILHQQEGDSASSGGAGSNSIGSSPAKKRRSTSSSVHAGNGGGESAEGSLLEFERIEQEIIGQDDGGGGENDEELMIKMDERKEEMPTHLSAAAAAITATRGSAESISGSISSLTEFEQLEKEVREAVGIGDEIMILSDIREESEEGALEEDVRHKLEDEEEDDELERMSTREDEEEEEEEGRGMKEEEIEGKKEELLVEQAAETTIMLSSADSLEVEKPLSVQYIQQESQKMETSVDSLELTNVMGKSAEIEKDETDSLEEQQQEIKRNVEEQEMIKVHALNIPTRGNGNGSPSAPEDEEDDAEQTTFETVRINPTDGKEERLIRTAITRVRDPIHSRVRFVGTEDEQRVQAILEGRGDAAELETTDEEGNVTRVRTIVEREIVH